MFADEHTIAICIEPITRFNLDSPQHQAHVSVSLTLFMRFYRADTQRLNTNVDLIYDINVPDSTDDDQPGPTVVRGQLG